MDPQLGSRSAASEPRHPHFNPARHVDATNDTPGILSRLIRRVDSDGLCSDNETCGRGISPNATNLAIALGVV